jgi:SAM-dependent methyltransferase
MPCGTVNLDRLLRATARAEARHFWFRGFRAFVTPLLSRATADQAAGARTEAPRLLDCGCGTGANVPLLGRFGRAYGFDLSRVGLGIGLEAGRMRLARATVTAAPFPSGIFDVVTSFDVLYALEDHDERSAIDEMYRLLKPGGFAVVNVAATPALRGDHSVLSHEIRRYDRRGLRDRLTAGGFRIIRLTYTNATMALPLLVVRTLQRRRGLRQEHDAQREIAVPPAPVNALLTAVLMMESLWLRWFDLPVGSSLLCLAQRPRDDRREAGGGTSRSAS